MFALRSSRLLPRRVLGLAAVGMVGLAFGCGAGAADEALAAPSEPASPHSAVVVGEEQSLQSLVQSLGAEVSEASPGTELAIAVRDLTSGVTAGLNLDEPFVAASAVKAVYVAAALHAGGVQALAGDAEAIFRRSDPAATAAVLDRTGASAIRRFYGTVGMSRSSPGVRDLEDAGTLEHRVQAEDDAASLTARDALRFLSALDAGQLLSPAETAAMRAWMRLSPRTGFGGWLGTKLPSEARAGLMHKAGWQPQGPLHILNEVGIVQVPHGHRYAVVLLARRGTNFWGAQIPFVEQASLRIYRVVAAVSAAPRTVVEP